MVVELKLLGYILSLFRSYFLIKNIQKILLGREPRAKTSNVYAMQACACLKFTVGVPLYGRVAKTFILSFLCS